MTEHIEEQLSKVGEFYRAVNVCCSQPMMALAELNAKTISNAIVEQNKLMEHVLEVKKPEEFVNIYTEIAGRRGQDITKYSQEVFNILSDATAAVSKLYNNAVSDAVKSGETLKHAAGIKRKR